MPEREDDGIDRRPSEEALERMLTELGPLLRRRAEVGAPDATFVARLRAQLAPEGVDDRDTGDGPVVARPSPLHGQRRRRRLGYVVGIAAALVVALLIAVVGALRLQRHDHTPAVAWRPPLPSLADLTRGFPAPSVAHATRALSPTVRLAAPPHVVPYPGQVRLST